MGFIHKEPVALSRNRPLESKRRHIKSLNQRETTYDSINALLKIYPKILIQQKKQIYTQKNAYIGIFKEVRKLETVNCKCMTETAHNVRSYIIWQL